MGFIKDITRRTTSSVTLLVYERRAHTWAPQLQAQTIVHVSYTETFLDAVFKHCDRMFCVIQREFELVHRSV